MREKFMKLMCCPSCREELELKIEKKRDDDVMEGLLTCTKCKAEYKIKNGIPYMTTEK